ncbi:hypothetical protein P280DRAFT_425794 [Massarina eburnea CBS 473.64]|uniref:Uncharacterized protein n=1 Tax=Massarina eburnea CBS 473.64 TaxID=1395130 RepID=A0A6A6S3T2_9PLEO|nr:hypothetical protein P280DRAFT_425794 [Massarina eburnea CBS 473.64]
MSKPKKTPVPIPGSKPAMPMPKKTQVPLPGSKSKSAEVRRTPVPLPGSSKSKSPEVRRTPVPITGSKPKTAMSPPESALSQEFVGSSDDASEVEAKSKAIPKKAPVQIAVHRPKSTQKQKDSVKTSAPKPVPKKVVDEKDDASDTLSSGSEEESEDEPETDMKKAQQREKASAKTASHSDSSSDSSSEESEDETAPTATPKAAASQSRPTPTKTHNIEFEAAKPYVPPKGFHPASTSQAQSSAPTALFNNLEGKQVWHITAPADVSLKHLKELAMEQALDGGAVLQHKNTSYGFSNAEMEDNSSREVIIPRQTGYKAVSARISHTFHLREVVNLPKLSSLQADPDTGSEAAASITRSTIRAPKPLVRGLKMRYFPSGVYDHTPVTLGSSDDEDDGQPARNTGLAVPSVVHLPVGKRKHGDTNVDERMEGPTKKHKRHKTAEEMKRKEEKKAKKTKKEKKEKKGKSCG